MVVDFFIHRPIFATVCALLIILAGAVAIPTLPVAQFPNLAPPQVSVNSFYNGASAQVVETSVTTPLEQQINGVKGMKYITSNSGNDGSSTNDCSETKVTRCAGGRFVQGPQRKAQSFLSDPQPRAHLSVF